MDAVFNVLKLPTAQAHVPVTWGLEVANGTAKTEAQGIILANRLHGFLATIVAAPIVCDTETYPVTINCPPTMPRSWNSPFELPCRLGRAALAVVVGSR